MPQRMLDLLSAGIAVVLVRIALWTLPSRVVLRLVAGVVSRAHRAEEITPAVRRVGRSVRTVSRRVPQATCLTQALAAQVLLAASGYSSTLQIGVALDQRRRLVAHAWVEVCGRVLVGGRGVGAYHALPDLRSKL